MPLYVLKNPAPEIKKLYAFGKRIGQPGQFGYACLCEKKCKDGKTKTLAVKVIRKERFFRGVSRAYTNRMFNSLRNEIEIMKKAAHKNVIKYEDSFEDAQNLYIAMEACSGGELFDRIQEVQSRSGFSEASAAALLRQIFEGLRYLHDELKIAHCDLKPDNFLFVERKENSPMRIIDFGMAKFLDSSKFFRDLCGTPYYIAPEVWKGQYSNACDMWSMGVITFVMLFGYPPFHGQTKGGGECEKRIRRSIEAGFKAVVKNGYGAHFPRAISRSKGARDFIARLLQMEPAKRLTAEEALAHPWLKGKDASEEKFDPLIVKGIRNFEQANRFKFLILENLVEDLEDEEVKKLRAQFHKMDEDGSGEVEISELAKILGDLKPKEVKRIMDTLDVDGDGKISISEFSIAFLNRKVSSQQERMWNIFTSMDLNGDGVLDKEEIYKALSNKLSKQEAEALLTEVDKDGNGKIEYNEFLEAWHVRETKKFIKEK